MRTTLLLRINTSDVPIGQTLSFFCFGKPKPFSEVQIYRENQTKRVETFDIRFSHDEEKRTTVWEGESLIKDEFVSYTFDDVIGVWAQTLRKKYVNQK